MHRIHARLALALADNPTSVRSWPGDTNGNGLDQFGAVRIAFVRAA